MNSRTAFRSLDVRDYKQTQENFVQSLRPSTPFIFRLSFRVFRGLNHLDEHSRALSQGFCGRDDKGISLAGVPGVSFVASRKRETSTPHTIKSALTTFYAKLIFAQHKICKWRRPSQVQAYKNQLRAWKKPGPCAQVVSAATNVTTMAINRSARQTSDQGLAEFSQPSNRNRKNAR